jgi:hypothetical protein
MKIITKFLTEHFPTHPLDTVIKNKFYPRGLREIDIYNYYLSQKENLLKWIDGRNVGFLIRTDFNTTVMIRNMKGKIIYLTESNFEDLITGRTNVIYVIHPELTDYFVIDIDVGPNLTMKHCKNALNILLHSNLNLKKHEAIYTSDKGIHLIGYVSVPSNLEILRGELEISLEEISDKVNQQSNIKFLVNTKGRKSNTINFDLSSMYPNSLHISKYSLTKEFLICNDVNLGLKKIS